MVAIVFRTISVQPDHDQLGDRSPKIAVLKDDAKAEVLAFSAFPAATDQDLVDQSHERLSKEVKRRPASWASSPATPPSSASSAPSWPTSTTDGEPATAATSPEAPWRCSTASAILTTSPSSHPGVTPSITSKPTAR
jgi:putative transposase